MKEEATPWAGNVPTEAAQDAGKVHSSKNLERQLRQMETEKQSPSLADRTLIGRGTTGEVHQSKAQLPTLETEERTQLVQELEL